MPKPAPLGRSLVLVTGASSGIGRAAAAEFLKRGARVIGVSRTAERVEELRAGLAEPDRLTVIAADVTEAAAMARMSAAVLAEHGVPDVVVANAGIGLDAEFPETSDEALRAVFEVNVFGLVRTVRPFVRPMIERGSGRILLVSSIVGKRGIPHYSAYSASKFALHGLADALRAELVGSGVSVGLVCPSTTSTEFQERLLRQGRSQRRVRPRQTSAEEVGRAVVRMAESNRREIVLAMEAKLLVLADLLFPGWIDRLLHRLLTRH